jgi:hypothetical protein
MAKRRKREPWESISYSHNAFRPYVAAIGQLSLAWNAYHEEMSLLFCTIMGSGFANQYLAVWHAVRSDRDLRAVLRAAAISCREVVETKSEVGKRLVSDVTWVTNQGDSIEETRNNVLHSPLWGYGTGLVMPLIGLGHERALKLAKSKRGLLAEFRWCRDAAITLSGFVKDLDKHLSGRRQTWPDRPPLPNRGDGNNPHTAHKPKSRKALRTLPRSSQAKGLKDLKPR